MKNLGIKIRNLHEYGKSKIVWTEMKKKEGQNKTTGSKSEIGWGHQIRSYIFATLPIGKDNRTNFESTNPEKMLSGEIDKFLEKSLHQL